MKGGVCFEREGDVKLSGKARGPLVLSCDLKGRVNPDFRFESSILRLGEILSVFIEPKLASRDCSDAVLGISFPFLPAVRCLQHRPPPPSCEEGLGALTGWGPVRPPKGPSGGSKTDWPGAAR